MQTKFKLLGFFLVICFSAIIFVQCTKENFIEPADPFEIKRLEPNPYKLTLGEGENKITLKTNHENITETGNGLRIKGGLFAENSQYGDFRISNGEFELIKNKNGEGYSEITGVAIVDLPKEGLLKDLIKTGMSISPVGFKKGSEFETGAFGWPVDSNKYYFYYELDTPFDATITNSSLKNIKELALDPLDPYFFISCDFNGTPFGKLSDVGLAISSQGLIPFERQVDYYDKVKNFSGNIYLSAALSIKTYHITIHGETVIGFDSDDPSASDIFFAGEISSYKQGFNGKITFDNKALDWLDIEIVLGEASMFFERTTSGETKIAWAGKREYPPTDVSDFLEQVIGKDWNFLDYLIPLEQQEKFYGSIGSNLDDFELGFETKTDLKVGNHKINMGTMKLFFSPNRMYFYGSVNIAVLGSIGVKGSADKDGYFKFTGFIQYKNDIDWKILEINYNFDIDLTLKRDGEGISIKGSIDFEAEICLGIICIDFNTKLSVTIGLDGSFKIKFKIGICGKGFSVTISYKSKSALMSKDVESMEYVEIPYQEIPMQYRFAEDISYEEAMSDTL